MINKRYLCIIPARAGSKGIKNKNFLKINKKPLIQYTIDIAKKLNKFCDLVISSDSKQIKKICSKNNIKFYGYRPKKLSGDKVLTYNVVKYELQKLEKINQITYDGLIILQPTCPIRKLKKLIDALKILNTNKYDSVVSVTPVLSMHPERMKKFRNNYLINYLNKKKENMIPRQNLPPVYIRSGSVYMLKRDVLIKQRSLVGKKTYGLVLDGLEAINIDTKDDLKLLKIKLKR